MFALGPTLYEQHILFEPIFQSHLIYILFFFYNLINLTQAIGVGLWSIFDINWGWMNLSLYSVGGMKIGFGGLDAY